MWQAFAHPFRDTGNVLRYSNSYIFDCPNYQGSIYRVWSVDRGDREIKYMRVVPWYIALGLVGIIFFAYLAWRKPAYGLTIAIVVIAAMFICWIFNKMTRRKRHVSAYASFREKRRQKRKEKSREKEAEYRRWLLENFELSKRQDRVRLEDLPVPLTLSGKTVQTFRVGYWTLKAKICKPYAVR